MSLSAPEKYNSLSFYTESNEWTLQMGQVSGEAGWSNKVTNKTFSPGSPAGLTLNIPSYIYTLKLQVTKGIFCFLKCV